MAYQQPVNYYQQPYFPANNAVPDALNQFKGQYQSYQQPIPQPQAMASDMIWVLGEVEATSYPVAPNATVILWDKNEQTIYIKSANAQGIPSMRVLDYTDRSHKTQNEPAKHECTCGSRFVPKEDFEALRKEIDTLTDRVEALSASTKPKSKKEKEKEAE